MSNNDPSTSNAQASEANSSEAKKNSPEPPKTPDIQFTRAYHRTNDSKD